MKKALLVISLIFSLLIVSLNASEEVPTQEEVSKLYVATFNRAPDSAGLNYWVNDSGLKLSEIAKSFFDQEETQALYPSATTNSAFIRSVYLNLFNREPDAAGLAYWENELNNGNYSKNLFIQTVINGAQGYDATILSYKNEVGLSFADKGFSETAEAKRVMDGITADSGSVEYALGKIESGELGEDLWNGFSALVITSPSTVLVDENQKNALTITATASDGSTVIYSLAGEDAASFRINSSTGVVTFKDAPDFEEKSTYVFTAIATTYAAVTSIENRADMTLDELALDERDASGHTTSQSVTVSINDVVEVPVLALFKKAMHMDQSPGEVVGKVKVINSGDGDIISYSLSGTRDFMILRNGVIINLTPFDFDEDTTLVFKIHATNSDGVSGRNNALVTVIKDNTPPVAFDQNVTVYMNSIDNPIDLNGTDIDGDDLNYTVVTDPEYGTLSGSGAHRTYTPEAGYYGTDTFTFKVNDGREDSEVATVNISIIRCFYVDIEDFNPNFEGSDSLYGWETDGSATVVESPNSDEGSQYLLLTSFNVSVSGIADAFSGVTVSDLNNAAQASLTNGAYAKTNILLEVGDELTVRYNFDSGDYSPYNDSGLVIIDGNVQKLSSVNELPSYGETGWQTFTYTAIAHGSVELGFTVLNDSDTISDSSLMIDNIQVYRCLSDNTPPVAIDQNVTVYVNSTDNHIDLNGTDEDGDDLNYTIVTEPTHGVLSGSGVHRTYTPEAGYMGEDSFIFMVNDGRDDSEIATVSIVVENYQCANVALHKPVTPYTGAVRGDPVNITDGDHSNLWYSWQGSCSSTEISFTLDLQDVYQINRMVFRPLQTYSYKIESSLDGQNWVERYNNVINYNTDTQELIANPSYSARYFRYSGYNYACGYVGMVEFEVYHCGVTALSSCKDILESGASTGDGDYTINPTGTQDLDVYCDMTTDGGGWTMWYTTDNTYSIADSTTTATAYGTDGYSRDLRELPFTEILYHRHSDDEKDWFSKNDAVSIKVSDYIEDEVINAGGANFGLWTGDGGADTGYDYQLTIGDNVWMEIGLMISGYTMYGGSYCYKMAGHWCGDITSNYYRINGDFDNRGFTGVAFRENGHEPNVVNNKLMSAGVR